MLNDSPGDNDDHGQARVLLERALDTEYRHIFHYPRLARLMPSPELAKTVRLLGQDSLRHAELVSGMIESLGGASTVPTVEPLPAPLDVRQLFEQQLEREKLGLYYHITAAGLLEDSLADRLRLIAQEEQWHIRLTEQVLAALDQAPYR